MTSSSSERAALSSSSVSFSPRGCRRRRFHLRRRRRRSLSEQPRRRRRRLRKKKKKTNSTIVFLVSASLSFTVSFLLLVSDVSFPRFLCVQWRKGFVLHILEGRLEIRFTIYYPNSYYIFPSLAPPPPSRERACAKTRKERTRLDECVSRRARRRGIKKQRGVSLYYRVLACLLLLEVDLLSRESGSECDLFCVVSNRRARAHPRDVRRRRRRVSR